MAMKRIGIAFVAAALLALAFPSAATAETGTTTKVCHDELFGMMGYLFFSWAKNSTTGQVTYIGQIKYKIDKNGVPGGNHANVDYNDNTTSRNPDFTTGDNGIQDNQWHFLGAGGDYYRSGGGAVGVHFKFDLSRATDVAECGIYVPLA